MPDDAASLLFDAGQEARHIDQGHQGNVEGITEADEAGTFIGRIDVERAGTHRRLIGKQANHHALDARETNDEIFRETCVHFEKVAVIHQACDHQARIQRRRAFRGDQRVHLLVRRLVDIGGQPMRRFLGIVGWQKAQQSLREFDRVLVVVGEEMHVAAHRGMHRGTADFVHRHGLAVTALMTSGPVMNIWAFDFVMMTKSINAGE